MMKRRTDVNVSRFLFLLFATLFFSFCMGGLATADTRLTDLDCWGGSSCAANSPYLIKLNGKAVLILGFFFSVGLLKIISAKKISKSSIWLAISTVILTLYINSGYGGIEVFFSRSLRNSRG